MILRSLRVKGWRCFGREIALTGLSERIQVIAAPNGTGKSSLFEALRRVVADRHRSAGEEMKAVRPWGTDLAPAVEIEFVTGGDEYRLAKQWLAKPFARLERRDGERYEPLAEDEAAEARVLEMFGLTAPGSGLSKEKHWGLFQVLWATQGRLEVAGLADDLVTRIRAELGTQIAAVDTSDLDGRVERAYGAWFTPKGKWKTGKDAPPLVAAKKRIGDLTKSRGEILERLETLERLQRRVEEARSVRTQAKAAEVGIEKELGKVRDAAREYSALVAERDRRAAEAAAAEADHARLTDRIEALATTRKERSERAAAIERLETDRAAAAAEATAREGTVRRARDADRLAEARRRVRVADDVLTKLSEVRAELARRKEERAGLAAPDAATLKRIRALDRDRSGARAEVRAASVRLRIELTGDARVEVTRGDEIESGEEKVVSIRGAPDAAARIEGVARITAHGPTGDAADRLRGIEEELRELTAGYGTPVLEELEAAADRARELDHGLETTAEEIDRLLDGRDEEELLEQREHDRRLVVELSEACGPAEELDLEAEREALRGVRQAENECRVRIEETAKALASLTERREKLTADGVKDEDRAKERGRAAIRHDAAREKLAVAERELGKHEGDPRKEESRLAEMLEEHRKRANRARDEENREATRLRVLSDSGDWVNLAAVEEELAALRREVESEEARANAVRLLRDTLADCRAEALAAVAGPVASAATYYFHRIAGARLGEVSLGSTLAPERVRPERAEGAVSEGVLSGGEREQLHLSVRLALADVLATEERQLVVLDDVLTATDTGRLARVLDLLDEAAERLQIVILTCHPERYSSLGEADTLDLSELISR